MKNPFPDYRYDAALVADIEDHLDMIELTEIDDRYPASLDPESDGYNLIWLEAAGRHQARMSSRVGDVYLRGNHTRPMFQIYHDGATSSMQMVYADPCSVCDNWAYTAKCERHPDRSPLDRPPVKVYSDRPAESPMVNAIQDLINRQQRAYAQQAERALFGHPSIHGDPPAFAFNLPVGNTPRAIDVRQWPIPEGTQRSADTFVLHVEAESGSGPRGFQIEVRPADEH